jgi:hypothetical protein
MASVFLKVKVADFDKWKSVFESHQDERKQEGMTGHSIHRSADDPNTAIVAFRTSDLNKTRNFALSDRVREIMQEAGVQGPPEFWFAEDVEEKKY